jgi:hypothetical protein
MMGLQFKEGAYDKIWILDMYSLAQGNRQVKSVVFPSERMDGKIHNHEKEKGA